MTNMKSWMLGAAMVAGAAALGAPQAGAAEFGIYVRGPVAYVPPCPGPDYLWVEGYMANGYWLPGHWEYRAPRMMGRGYGSYEREGWRGQEGGGGHDGWREREGQRERQREGQRERNDAGWRRESVNPAAMEGRGWGRERGR